MRKILILGAGRSASSLIHYLITHADQQEWRITVADKDAASAARLVHEGPTVATGTSLDATDADARATLIAEHDLVISMLPAFMHMDVLKDCLRLKKHVITPSYVPDALWALDEEFQRSGLIVLNEMGLDPGIDHMSAMRILDRIRHEGGRMEAFESYCGGLVAPESDDNPWGYKFSWNPRNVILAGQGGAAKYIRDGITKYIPYHKLFQQIVRIACTGPGQLRWLRQPRLLEVPQGTMGWRTSPPWCAAPCARPDTVRLGMCSSSWAAPRTASPMELPAHAPWSDYLDAFLPHHPTLDTRANLAHYLGLEPAGPVMQKLDWLGLFGNGAIGSAGLSPAATLQGLLEQKWKLGPEDKDLVVMWHRFRYQVEGQHQEIHASLGVIGQGPNAYGDGTHGGSSHRHGLQTGAERQGPGPGRTASTEAEHL
jgi:hypothetical protein